MVTERLLLDSLNKMWTLMPRQAKLVKPHYTMPPSEAMNTSSNFFWTREQIHASEPLRGLQQQKLQINLVTGVVQTYFAAEWVGHRFLLDSECYGMGCSIR